MARYTEAELSSLKQSLDLVALIQSKGIKLEKHGSKDLKGLCPFHQDKNPSMIVTPHKQLFNCPSCGTGGDVIAFIQKYEGLSFTHAVELLKNKNHSAVFQASEPVKSSRARKLPAPVKLDSSHYELLDDCINFYHKTLLESQPALSYLKKRGLDSPELIKTFKLGFANRTLGLRVPEKSWKEGAQLRLLLQETGLFRKDSGHEHFNGSIVFPIFDEQNHITEIYGRKIRDDLRKGTAYHLYLPGPHKGIFNSQGLFSHSSSASEKSVILCEAIIDALTFWTHGFKNVTASFGTGGFTEDHLKAFIKHGIQKVYIAYDADDSGNKAAEELAQTLSSEGMQCLRVKLPHGSDVNDFALQIQNPKQALQKLLLAAHFMAGSGQVSTEEKQALGNTDEENNKQSLSIKQTVSVPHEVCGDDHLFSLGNRLYRVRGLERNTSFDVLKINLRLSLKEDNMGQGSALFYLDTFDFYNARHRKSFLHAAATECGLEADVIKRDLGRILLKLEELQDKYIQQLLEPKEDSVPQLSEKETEEALNLLKSPDLIERIVSDFRLAGLVGEDTNALVSYLAAVSRKTDDPLAIIIQSSSSAGKSSVMDAALAFMPDEELIRYTSMTGQSLFYMGETSLKHKILAISEEEGAEQAGYALKILQSEKQLKIASTGKDPKSGRLITQEYKVEGPCVIFMTTTNVEVDEELQNRCLVLTVNEDREQTKRIHELQRKSRTLEGLLTKEKKKTVLTVHRNAQRLIRPLMVVNPYAEQLTFLDSRLRTRRDHIKYLNIINAITLLHQHQREIKTVKHGGETLEYIEVTLEDIETANRLAADIMGTSLDELAPQSRKLLNLLVDMRQTECEKQEIEPVDFRFTRREVRDFTGWGNTQLKVHMNRLLEMEYLHLWKGSIGQSFIYELLYKGEGNDGQSFVMNLINTTTIAGGRPKTAGGRPPVGEVSAGGRTLYSSVTPFKRASNS